MTLRATPPPHPLPTRSARRLWSHFHILKPRKAAELRARPRQPPARASASARTGPPPGPRRRAASRLTSCGGKTSCRRAARRQARPPHLHWRRRLARTGARKPPRSPAPRGAPQRSDAEPARHGEGRARRGRRGRARAAAGSPTFLTRRAV